MTAHPEYNITVLLRDPKASFTEKYPNVKVLKGDFGNTELLKDAASKADIVVRRFIDHLLTKVLAQHREKWRLTN